jgi:hypothetical protein
VDIDIVAVSHIERGLAIEIERAKQDEQPIESDHPQQRSEGKVYGPQDFIEKFKHAASLPSLEKRLKPVLAMLVAQSSRHYKNTNCLAALLENDGAFVTEPFL